MSAASYMRVMGANDKVNLGLIGAGGRGKGVMGTFQKTDQVNVTAVCDIYAARVDEGLSRAPGAKGVNDHRKLLEMKDVDAVLIATPDHWHTGTAIDALNAGKDVYVVSRSHSKSKKARASFAPLASTTGSARWACSNARANSICRPKKRT